MREQCGGLSEHWYVACLPRELGSQPISRRILEEDLVLFRGRDGAVSCFKDRCLHRNARLSAGRVDDGCLVCPYHGWTFDKQGRCVRVPSEGPESTGYSRKGLKSIPVIEQDGLIWVFMGYEEPGERTPIRIPFRQDGGWRSYYMLTDFDNNVSNCVENFMDVPHTGYVHEGWFRTAKQKRIPATIEQANGEVLVTYHQESDTIGFFGSILNPARNKMVHTDKFISPNVTRVDYKFGERHFIISSQCTPVSPLHTRVYTLIAYRLGGLHNLVLGPILPWYTRRVIEQDVDILRIQGEALAQDPREFAHTEADRIHEQIELLRAHAEHPERGEPEPVRRDITFHV